MISFCDYIPNRMETTIDHINFNKKDNRLKNLRIVSNRENIHLYIQNKLTSSKYIGVSKFRNKWQARIRILNKNHSLGVFDTEEEASEVYQKALEDHKKGLI
jgi:hypothetical protein